MAIAPISLQMTIPMTNDVAQVQNAENTRGTTEHMIYAAENEKHVKQQRETVVEKDTAEFTQYQYDAREKGNNEYSGDPNKKRKKKKEEEPGIDNEAIEKDKEKRKHVVQIDIKL